MTLYLSDLIRPGNKKLPKTTAIFNLGSAHGCPSRWLGMCPAINRHGHCICYALRDELQYPKILPYRRRQGEYWRSVTAERFVEEFLEILTGMRRPYTALRMNEAGDFGRQEDVDKAEMIARNLPIPVYCYTARCNLWYGDCRSLVVNASGWIPAEDSGVRGEFRLVFGRPDLLPEGFSWCPRSCHECDRCVVGAKTAALVWFGTNAKKSKVDERSYMAAHEEKW